MENKNKKNNFTYIDSANLHKGISGFGWQLDYKRFRVWLFEKYTIENAYIFIGLIPKYKDLYAISCLNDQKSILQCIKEKAPLKDETLRSAFSMMILN